MARTPFIPRELTRRPFSLQEAREAGLTLSALRSKAWRRLGRQLYCHNDLAADPWMVLSAWNTSLRGGAVFAGTTAGWLHGLDLEPTNPVAIAVPPNSGIRPQRGLAVRRCDLHASEVVTVRDLPVTTLFRTLSDLCLQLPAVEALVAIDMAVRAGHADATRLRLYADKSKGRAGSRVLRDLSELAAPAESPMETRLRWLLIQVGLPRPQVQTDLRDDEGRFVGRADLFYPAARLAIEFDGGNHRDRLVQDDRRQNLILNAGYRLLRFTGADIIHRPDIVEGQVRGALGVAARNARLTP
ncbi:MAG TPA: DUF559 domain-containing protein, partial [Candidatus Dormibacteraeota bacterium]